MSCGGDLRRRRRAQDQRDFIPLNAELAQTWKPITRTQPALRDAETWSKVQEKRDRLER